MKKDSYFVNEMAVFQRKDIDMEAQTIFIDDTKS